VIGIGVALGDGKEDGERVAAALDDHVGAERGPPARQERLDDPRRRRGVTRESKVGPMVRGGAAERENAASSVTSDGGQRCSGTGGW